MKTHIAHKNHLSEKIVVVSSDRDLLARFRTSTIEKASRLLPYNRQVDRILIDLERNQNSDTGEEFVAKGQIEFGGPALLASVMSHDPTKAVEYLIEQLERLLRRRCAPPKTNGQPESAAGSFNARSS